MAANAATATILIFYFVLALGSDTLAAKKGNPGNFESVQAALDEGRTRLLEAWGPRAVEPLWAPLQPQFWRDIAALRAGDDGYSSRVCYTNYRKDSKDVERRHLDDAKVIADMAACSHICSLFCNL
jgi:hypothetical protein